MLKLFAEIFKTSENFGLPRKEFFLAVARTRVKGSLKFFREIFCFACALGLAEFVEEKIREFPVIFPNQQMPALLDASAADGCPALILGVLNGHPRILTILLAYGANPNKTDRFGKTALLHACKKGDADAVEILLNCGGDATVEDCSGKNCMQLAIASKKRKSRGLCVELISAKFSEIFRDENAQGVREKIHAIFFEALGSAAEVGDMEILQSLTRNFQIMGDNRVRRPKSGSPPLISAVIAKKPESIKVSLNFQVFDFQGCATFRLGRSR